MTEQIGLFSVLQMLKSKAFFILVLFFQTFFYIVEDIKTYAYLSKNFKPNTFQSPYV